MLIIEVWTFYTLTLRGKMLFLLAFISSLVGNPGMSLSAFYYSSTCMDNWLELSLIGNLTIEQFTYSSYIF